jgi:hypothetical protein
VIPLSTIKRDVLWGEIKSHRCHLSVSFETLHVFGLGGERVFMFESFEKVSVEEETILDEESSSPVF